jgi:hypothetical protein
LQDVDLISDDLAQCVIQNNTHDRRRGRFPLANYCDAGSRLNARLNYQTAISPKAVSN